MHSLSDWLFAASACTHMMDAPRSVRRSFGAFPADIDYCNGCLRRHLVAHRRRKVAVSSSSSIVCWLSVEGGRGGQDTRLIGQRSFVSACNYGQLGIMH
jgi:hypothetical protein